MKYLLQYLFVLFAFLNLFFPFKGRAQDIHYSQFYNMPTLFNVSNTGLMSDRDFRASVIYRTQWASIPAPFSTVAAAAEFQTLRNDQFTNWMGVGVYFLSDKAGDGNLSNTQFGGSLAYHMLLNESNMLSFGMGASINNRSIDFSKLSFNAQWDGFTFNKSLPNGESRMFEKGNYINVMAGINYSFFPSELTYFKIGVGMAYINRPKVSLLGSTQNRLGMRPMASFDAILAMDNGWRISPSGYYSYMQKASEALLGVSVAKDFASLEDNMTGQIFTGMYYRFNESVIATMGIEWARMKLTVSYDFTTTALRNANNGNGAFEISMVYQGFYSKSGSRGKSPFECPRF